MIAFIEVVAMMIGEICQVYSPYRYESPSDIKIGQFLVKGQPKSLYRPGSSTDIIIFEKTESFLIKTSWSFQEAAISPVDTLSDFKCRLWK